MICRNCEHCEAVGQARHTRNNKHGVPRKTYYCLNPLTRAMPREIFGNRSRAFVGYGSVEYGSPLALKTSPKWCPQRIEREQKCGIE